MAATVSDIHSIPFIRSLAGRLLLLGILPGTVVIAAIVALGMMDKFETLVAAAEVELARETLVLAEHISKSNTDAIQAAVLIAAQQQTELFGQRKLTVDLLKAVLAADENLTAAYVLYEPNADAKDATAATTDPKEWMDATGRFTPYPFRDWKNGDAIAVKPSIDYETSLYYDGVRKAFSADGIAATMVTEPYFYEGQLLVEQSHPIVIDGKFRGIGAVDRALASIERVLRVRSAEIGVESYLISSRGRFVAATEDPEITADVLKQVGSQLRTHPVADSPIRALIEPVMRQATAAGFVCEMEDPRDGRELLVASVHLVDGDWRLICTKPREVVVASIRTEVWISALMFTSGLGLSMALVGWISISTGRRVRAAAVAADAISDGDLSVVIPDSDSNDEAGVLLRSLQQMKENLNGLLSSVQSAGVTLDSSALELSATSREQEGVAHRFGESSSQIAGATKQISATGMELTQTILEVDRAVDRTARLADGARGDLSSVDTTIRELAEATGSIAIKLSAISERASSINGVVTTIAKVADQTNLLSVNAAIEAEKAGEQGRGFLVVAREIRRLADQTASATVDIESMVREMQSAVGAGVMEMDRFAEKVRRGVDEVVASSRQMAEVIAQVEANAARFRIVADGMASQSQGAATISDSMGGLATSAKRAIDSAEEFRRTASELQRASQVLRMTVAAFTLDG